MKIEQRKIMLNQEVYVANDGTRFPDKYACQEYEAKLAGKTLEMYGSDFTKCDNLTCCTYVRLSTREEILKLIAGCEYYGISTSGIEGPGIYMCTGRLTHNWVNITEVMCMVNGTRLVYHLQARRNDNEKWTPWTDCTSAESLEEHIKTIEGYGWQWRVR